MNQITVREYGYGDFDSIVKFMMSMQKYFVELDQHREQKAFASKQKAEEYIRQALKDVDEMDGAIFIAESENQLAGFIQGVIVKHKDDVMHQLTRNKNIEGWIGLLFTDPQFRCRGVGTSLIKSMRNYFKKMNCSSVRLKVASNNRLAIKIYEKHGFKPRDLEMAVGI